MTASGESGHLTRSKALCGTPAAETLSRRAATFKMFKVGLNYRFGSIFGGGYGGSY
jgi:hypothetical protein